MCLKKKNKTKNTLSSTIIIELHHLPTYDSDMCCNNVSNIVLQNLSTIGLKLTSSDVATTYIWRSKLMIAETKFSYFCLRMIDCMVQYIYGQRKALHFVFFVFCFLDTLYNSKLLTWDGTFQPTQCPKPVKWTGSKQLHGLAMLKFTLLQNDLSRQLLCGIYSVIQSMHFPDAGNVLNSCFRNTIQTVCKQSLIYCEKPV